jgi:hypothetical protein
VAAIGQLPDQCKIAQYAVPGMTNVVQGASGECALSIIEGLLDLGGEAFVPFIVRACGRGVDVVPTLDSNVTHEPGI